MNAEKKWQLDYDPTISCVDEKPVTFENGMSHYTEVRGVLQQSDLCGSQFISIYPTYNFITFNFTDHQIQCSTLSIIVINNSTKS